MSVRTQTEAMFVSDGGLGSLVALWRERARWPRERSAPDIRAELRSVIRGEPSRGSVVLCVAPAGTPGSAAAARQADLSGLLVVQSDECGQVESLSSVALLRAADVAVARGLSRVVWPVHLGGGSSSEPMTTAADRAAQVAQLALLDLPRAGGPRTLEIETPLLELSDAQVLELALDLDAPLPRPLGGAQGFRAAGGACWWCDRTPRPGTEGTMCGSCTACRRWGRAWAAADPAGLMRVGGT